MRRIWPLLLLAPLAAAAVASQQDVRVDAANQAPFAVLSSGDAGTATIGASGTRATVSVADSSILTADDVLDITSTSAAWTVQAEYRSHTGFAGLTTSLTISLRDGVLSPSQITIANGAVTKTSGTPADLVLSGDTEVFAATTLLASGSVTFDLVLRPDSGTGPALRYPVTLTVT